MLLQDRPGTNVDRYFARCLCPRMYGVRLRARTQKTSLASASEGHEVHPGRPRSNKALHSTPDLPLRPLPLNSGPSPTTPGYQRKYIRHEKSPTLTPEQLERRKGNMAKLMRHLGESRIPSDLLLSQPQEDATRDEQRAKSLDLRPLSDVFEETLEPPPRLTRSRSLNLKSQRRDWEPEAVEPLPDFVNEELKRSIKRNRKITKILGPEVTHDLMSMLAEGKERSRAADKPQLKIVPTELSPVEDQAEEAPSLARCPSTDLARLAYDLTDDEGGQSPIESEPPTPNTEHPPVDDRRRAQKLANFFGVDQIDVSTQVTSSVPPSAVQPTLPPAQQTMQSVTEIDVQISGRRFWGSPGRAEFKNAHMADAIHQLRALKAA
ncbi:hypothetical protein BKA70DRAFT_327713 [Coprinopsis sp. MPI-PUGE-AT-0042]|nr:hypothetical protein BKA70DRAFT_327713 [Coprinopsis sp. MPI-PUGE-AT-0042]